MRIIAVVAGICLVSSAAYAADEPVTSVSLGVKSENLRFGGGKVVSTDTVLVSNDQITYRSGAYVRLFATAGTHEKDDEFDPTVGIVKPCFHGFSCRVEAAYWILPKLAQSRGDLINLAGEISRTRKLGGGQFTAAVRYEDLIVFGGPGTQLYRVNAAYIQPIAGVPVKAWVEYDYNAGRRLRHVPLAFSATLKPSWFPRGTTLVPSAELLLPLNDRHKRRVGKALGLALARTF